MIERFDVGPRLSEMAVHNGVCYLAGQVAVGAAQSRWVPVNVQVPADVARRLGGGAHALTFEITSTERPDARVVEPSTFIVPR